MSAIVSPSVRPRASVPDVSGLPDGTLLTRKQLAQLSGFSEAAFRKWAREGRGPEIVYLEGRPRTTVGAFKAWISGKPAGAA